jgi:hypothetical protein
MPVSMILSTMACEIPAATERRAHPRVRPAFALALVTLVLLSLAVRFQRPHASGQLVEREFRTAILARSFAFAMQSDVPQWRLDASHASRVREGALEPPITELVHNYGFPAFRAGSPGPQGLPCAELPGACPRRVVCNLLGMQACRRHLMSIRTNS